MRTFVACIATFLIGMGWAQYWAAAQDGQFFKPGEKITAQDMNEMMGNLIALNSRLISTEAKVKELERKMQGVQKQVTILHAKKADKE